MYIVELNKESYEIIFPMSVCRPRWSRGNELTSRSKVRGFKPG